MAALAPVLDWLEDPRPKTVNIHERSGGIEVWRSFSQAELASSVRAGASALREAGAERNSRILIALGTGARFIQALFAAAGVGAVASPIEPPGPLTNRTTYRVRLTRIIAAVRPDFVIGDAKLDELIGQCDSSAYRPTVVDPETLAAGDPDTTLTFGGDFLVGQLTSGTTGVPKVVRLTADQVSAHVAAISRWLDMGDDDVGVSWLPLHHDMGLIGHLLLPLAMGVDEFLLTPNAFIRRPVVWLEALSAHSGTITAAPTFGYRYLLDRIDDADLAGLDLSACKAAIVGAERVDASVLLRTASRLAPCGLRATALRPAYGLAEATLAVTGTGLGVEPQYVRLGAGPLDIGALIQVKERRQVGSPDSALGPVHVACGRPIPGTTVTLEDGDGTALPEGVVGEVVVQAPWVGEAPILRTGDVGFRLDGELYVLGRMGDSVSVRGRRVFASDLEAVAMAETSESVVVVMGDADEGPIVLTFVEGRMHDGTADLLHSIVERHVDRGATSLVVGVTRGSLPRTSSGKPRRREIWSRHVADEYRARIVSRVDLRSPSDQVR